MITSKSGRGTDDFQLPVAALIALEDDDIEVATLLLKVLGWESHVAADFASIPMSRVRLLVMGGRMLPAFLNLSVDVNPSLVSTVVVDSCDQALIEAVVSANIICSAKPLDVAELESLIALAT